MAYLNLKTVDNVILLRSLIDKAYDTGYYAGNGRSGKPEFNSAKRDRDVMWKEMEGRLDTEALRKAGDDLAEIVAALENAASENRMDAFAISAAAALPGIKDALRRWREVKETS